MTYTTKHAQENRAIAARVPAVLKSVGWTPCNEPWYQLARKATVLIAEEFPDVDVMRVEHQVLQAMFAFRGWRKGEWR